MKKSIHTILCRIKNLSAFFVPLFFLFFSSSVSAQTPDSWGNGQCALPCNDQINISLDSDGLALIDPILVWEEGGSYACIQYLDSIETTIEGASYYDLVVDGIVTHSAVVDCGFVGQNVEYHLTKYYNDGTVNSCWGNVLVEDKMAPSLDGCDDVYVYCNEDYSPDATGYPTAIDNCDTDVELTYDDEYVDLDCDYTYEGYYVTAKIIRTWTAVDNFGNSTTCTQTIYLKKATILDIELPQNVVLDCSDDPNDPLLTGVPTINGQPIENGGTCELAVTYEDTVLPLCEGSTKVLRRYTFVDWCGYDVYSNYPEINNGVFVHVQKIELLDTTAPEITCGDDITISTSSADCTGNTALPLASVSDDCSPSIDVVTTTPDGDLAGNGGVVYGLPLGETIITYTATDRCGNSSTCSLTVTVTDDISPVAICDEHTTVSLGSAGSATVCASTFDDGSYDNCEVADLAVLRMDAEEGTPFTECVNFSCEDIGTTVMVILKVTDAAGNENTCMVEVDVEDKLDPIIVCPPNKDLECTDDYTNLGLTGEATGFDNCGDVEIVSVDSVNINNCGEGIVIRTFTATDAAGLTAVCEQVITLTNNNPFNGHDIEWPLDYDANTCGADIEPENLPEGYSEPIISEGYCDLVAVTHTDELLPIAGDACFKIIRHWVVIDWCQYNPNSDDTGRYEYSQIIKVNNDIAPVFTSSCDDVEFCSFEADCGDLAVSLWAEATDDCSADEDINYSYVIDAFSDGSTDFSGATNDANGEYPSGAHTITWYAEDGCGNVATCSYVFTIKDCKKPSPVCINGLAAELMPSAGMITLWASDFVSESSFDNCTAFDDLQFSFSADTDSTNVVFTCANIGTQFVEIWATDEAGNQDYCSTYVLIQDNMGGCPNNELSILGEIQNEMGETVEDVTVSITGSNAVPSYFTTDANGSFAFPQLPTDSYDVAAEKNMNPTNGVTTFDLVIISKHILAIESLDSPYKMIAADVNRSASITTFDLVQLRRLILNIDTEFTNNNSWRFVDRNYDFINPANPLAEAFPEVISYDNMDSDELNADFVAIKVGDVNATALPNSLVGAEDRTGNNELVFNIDEADVKANETYTVEFKANDFKAVLGYQFTIAFDQNALEFVSVNAADLANVSNDNFGLNRVNEGVITTSWNDTKAISLKNNDVVFSITFNAKSNATLSNAIKVSSQYTLAEAYQNDEVANIALTFNRDNEVIATVADSAFELYQNSPNPVQDVTNISFNLPQAGTATLSILDVSGKVLKVIRGEFAKGFNNINISKDDITGSGVLFYQLDTENDSATKKMIIIK